MKVACTILILLSLWQNAMAQTPDFSKLVDEQQDRIDMLDNKPDGHVAFGKPAQNRMADQLYFTFIDQLQVDIAATEPANITGNYKALIEYLKTIQKHNVYHLVANQHALKLADKLLVMKNDAKELELLKTDLKTGIILSDFINLKTYAITYWRHVAKFYPTDLLNKFKNLAYTPIGNEVINSVAKSDPNAVKQYFGTNHLVDRALKNAKDSVVRQIYALYKTFGMQSKSFALLEFIYKKQMDPEDAEALSKNPRLFYKTLIELRKKRDILANYTVDKELQTLGMERVVEINMLHEEKDPIRFEPIEKDNAIEIYTAIVYSPEEIFTSSFIGMYKRMMEKRRDSSGYKFLQQTNFNKFRIFIKQCAGYNKLDHFFATMNDAEAGLLINMFAGGLYNYGGDLGPAVDVADTYGSLENEKIKKLFRDVIEKEYNKTMLVKNDHGIKIYGLLLKLTGGSPDTLSGNYTFDIPDLDRVANDELFIDKIHIQQHFFFDDEDGEMAYRNWLAQYPAANYQLTDKGSYVVFNSINGLKMEIYANKPSSEFAGREDLRKLFEKRSRFPDLIVHRGHSYYIENTLANMTNSNKIAILGSCGGYQNISKAMENAMDVQIISTKQVGTLAVNAVLINEITETIRLGKDIIWVEVWKRVAVKLKNNPQFKDYIPPYKNLGARFIKAYNDL